MIKAKDIMEKDVITMTPDMKIKDAAKLLLERHINGAPVLDYDGQVLGIICQSDLIAQQKKINMPSVFAFLDGFIQIGSVKNMEAEIKKMSAMTVADAMTENPETVSPEATIEEVASLIVDKRFHTIPVVENEVLVGVIGKEDILKTLLS
ncbi:CBS domain-containing protein [Desulforegula conservatrix]|uniref:CBS domain-containing protein n=1 Tax=Desulforegula conservatrix TaxID=153026 RepID=UPI0003F4FEA1|nr:CBS domain-containing protein [Desulforegula conservatrix]